MTAQPSTVPARRPRPLIMEWAIAGTATMSACLFSNPMEVVKTRMQVQNELAAHGQPQLYRNAFQAFWHVGRTEGIRGLQGGLAPSLLFQLTMNGTRLGLYEPMKRLVRTAAGGGPEGKLGAHTRKHDPPVFWHSMVAAGVSGAFAAFIGSPFFLVKVRLQIQSKQPQAAAAASVTRTAGAAAIPSAVGAQHAYTGMWSGLRSIYSEDGIRGLFRGASASIIRVTTGSVVQLSTYDRTKAAVMERTGWGESVKVQSETHSHMHARSPTLTSPSRAC